MARQYNDSNIQYSASNTTYNGIQTVTATASASLGTVTASATAVAVTPTPSYSGAGNPWWVKQPPKVKKVEERQPEIVLASAEARFGFDALAFSEIVWSILEDEADLLLLI